jgi:hypothetical protein
MRYIKMTKLVLCVFCLVILAGNAFTQDSPQQSELYAPVQKPDSKLSFRLEALSQTPALNNVSAETQGAVLSLAPSGPGSLVRDDQGRILVEILMADISSEQIQSLQDAGILILHVSDRYNTITALVDPVYLPSVVSITAVQSIMEVLSPQNNSTCPVGIAVSEGDTQLYASTARSNYSIDGTGVQVGVMSDSYNKYSSAVTSSDTDVTNGDLPGVTNTCGYTTAVNVLQEYASSGSDEGRGMMQIVHDLAPGTTKSFATAFTSLTSFADNIRNLRTAGADIIVDDVTYFSEPFFQEGPVNVAISDVVNDGALYFTSAGNANLISGGNNISSYEAPSYRSTTCPAAMSLTGDCHNFEPSGGASATSRITLPNGCRVRINLQWSEPWYGIATDIDIYLINSSDSTVASSRYNNITSNMPYEFLSYTNSTGTTQDFRIVINRYSGTGTPRLKYVFMQNGSSCMTSVQYNTSSGGDVVGPSLVGHSATKDGFSVAAVPYNNSNTPENFSSRGPATHYYGPVIGTTPASAITADVLQQPDFAATDGGCTSFFGSYSSSTCYRFYGTSAAAPHAAAVTALLKQRANQLSMPLTRMVTKYVLQATARTVSGGNLYSVGSGLIDANAAVAKISAIGSVIRVQGSTIVGDYTAIQTAYNNSSSSGDIIEMLATTFTETLTFNASKDVTLRGGYLTGYPSQNGNTTLYGTLTVSNGKVIVDGLALR